MSLSLDDNSHYFDETFKKLDCSDQVFSSLVFENCRFIECDFNDSTFASCTFIECSFERCQMNVIDVRASQFLQVTFSQCKLLAVDWTRADWQALAVTSALAFSDCNISSSSFYGLQQKHATFTHCKAHDVDFREANLSQANFSGCDLTASLFDNTDLSAANFSDAENYHINILSNTVSNAIFSRIEALNLLTALDINLVD